MRQSQLNLIFITVLFLAGCSDQITDLPAADAGMKGREIKTSYALPTTTIEFDLPEDAVVTLKIYNELGKVVAMLLDEVSMDAGVQEVSFDATGLPSGSYSYEIIARSIRDPAFVYRAVKRMMLVK